MTGTLALWASAPLLAAAYAAVSLALGLLAASAGSGWGARAGEGRRESTAVPRRGARRGVGAVLRYLLDLGVARLVGRRFPWGSWPSTSPAPSRWGS